MVDGLAVRWLKNWLDICVQRVTVNGSSGQLVSKWKPVESDVLQGSVLGAILLNIFISDTGSGIDLANLWMTPSSMVKLKLQRDAIQKDLGRLEKWSSVNLSKFSKAKYNVQHLG